MKKITNRIDERIHAPHTVSLLTVTEIVIAG